MNQSIFDFIFGFARRNIFLDTTGVFAAGLLMYFLILAALIALYRSSSDWRRRLFSFAEAALAVILARGLITEAFRFFYVHPRPFDALGIKPLVAWEPGANSFPSGHATFLFALGMSVFYVNRKWGTWLLALAAVNALARVFVGVHWPFDVLGGAIIGVLSAWAVHALLASSWKGMKTKTAW